MAECECDAVKLEGGREMLDVIKGLIKATIPVVGHLGLTPQSVAMLGGFKAQGRDASTAMRIIEDARILEETGICILLLEAVPPEVAKVITERAKTVCGIGAGLGCQCMIVHDMMGCLKPYRNL
jgi:3-methyl-2-oxobutanoate hydroxymethyltransferase